MDYNRLKRCFLKRLTVDSETLDDKKVGFNQAVFDDKYKWATFSQVDLDMIMDKFYLAIDDYEKDRYWK